MNPEGKTPEEQAWKCLVALDVYLAFEAQILPDSADIVVNESLSEIARQAQKLLEEYPQVQGEALTLLRGLDAQLPLEQLLQSQKKVKLKCGLELNQLFSNIAEKLREEFFSVSHKKAELQKQNFVLIQLEWPLKHPEALLSKIEKEIAAYQGDKIAPGITKESEQLLIEFPDAEAAIAFIKAIQNLPEIEIQIQEIGEN